MKHPWIVYGVLVALALFAQAAVRAQDTAQDTPPAAPPAASAAPAGDAAPLPGVSPPAVASRMTLMTMIQQGGVILWITMAMGFLGLLLTIYLLLTVTTKLEVPPTLVKRAQAQIKAGDLRGAYQMCLERDEMISLVIRAGLKMAGHDRYVIQEAMESEGDRGATALWQKVSYLNNIAMIAPLLGLLGTVWGMMQAFSSIALDTAQVKGLTMAYSVSQAMITTAGGLIVAIPAMAVYYYLRGRVIRIIAEVEAQASEFVELIAEKEQS